MGSPRQQGQEEEGALVMMRALVAAVIAGGVFCGATGTQADDKIRVSLFKIAPSTNISEDGPRCSRSYGSASAMRSNMIECGSRVAATSPNGAWATKE